jgi:hypothetical protein
MNLPRDMSHDLTRLVALVLLGVAVCIPAHAQPARERTVEGLTADDFVGHVYERTSTGEIVGRCLGDASHEAAQPALHLRRVAPEDVAQTVTEADTARAAKLADLPHVATAPRLVPEDLTRRARVFHVGVDAFTDAMFAEMLARVGQREGFSVVARVGPHSVWADWLANVPNLTLAELPGVQYVWSEDVLEVALDGSFQMTARVGDAGLIRRAVFVDRIRRYYPEVTAAQIEEIRNLPSPADPPGGLPRELLLRYPDSLFMIQGLVEIEGAQVVAAALARARGAALRQAMTYLEGGNVLLGTLPGGAPFALVGRDSVAVSRALLAHLLGRPVSEEEVTEVIAKDLGVERPHLFLVEQPGVFHLDMAMTLFAPGTVVFNDERKALRLQIAWLREDHEASRPRREAGPSGDEYRRQLESWEAAGRALEETVAKLTKYGERFIRAEARTLVDLEAAGLKVIRVPARFLHPARPPDRDLMNFVNGEAGTNAAGQGYFITQGGEPRAEHLIAAALLGPGTGLDRVYFAPRVASADSLWDKGGTACRVKVEGTLVGGR